MNKEELSTQHLSLLQLCSEPQSFDSISSFLNLEESEVKKQIVFLKHEKLIEEVKGPTYDFWQLSKKGKELLQL